MNNRFCYDTKPKALKTNIVLGENYRFTILTDRLIRMEFSAGGAFEDRATQSAFFRNFAPVKYTAERENGILTITTENLKLTYKEGKPFSAKTLSIKLLSEPTTTYHYGEEIETLGGTARTLDNINGEIDLCDGVCSLNGYAVIDDSNTLALNDKTGWVELREKGAVDLYFFGYGYKYLDAVKDYYRLTGIPPMLPDYALGNWWSRYHKYTDKEYIDLMETFKAKNVPLSVGVIDMDWHIVDIPEALKTDEKNFEDGWTGYTWNKELFPDYKAFLKYLHDNNIHTSLNLHPHAGVRRHEDQYEEMSKACGIDPKTGKRVPFDILNPDFMEKYFDILHHPYEKNGVDFWWMDWQQGTNYWWIHDENKNGKLKNELEVLDPLWMLNHLHIKDIMRNGKRPMFFSRFCGVGAQRYPVGFSGDTVISWESLNFQPYFTATASNVGYTWWSHDIGGHFGGYYDEELTTRWIQLGVFSPINRLHSTNDKFIHKEPWAFAPEKEKIVSDYLRLRHELFPYIYTMNYRTHTFLEPLIKPMYYDYPKCRFAYDNKNQFMFGSELLVAPITEKSSSLDKLGRADLFLPKGIWFDFFTGTPYRAEKNRNMRVFRTLDKYPVFARAGAIVPMQKTKSGDNRLGNSENLKINVFAGGSNTFTLYEDKGDYMNYQNGEFAKTEMSVKFGKNCTFKISAAGGDTSFLPKARSFEICLKGFGKGLNLTATVDGKKIKISPLYNAEENCYNVLVKAKIKSEIVIVAEGENLIADNSDRFDACFKILDSCELSNCRKNAVLKVFNENRESPCRILNNIHVESLEEQHFYDAIKEQLSLNKSVFEG